MSAVDLVLSSGFLAFARHLGFLDAVEAEGVEVDGVCGTSSGALVGALWAAGHPLDTVAEVVAAQTPLTMCAPHLRVWQGAFRMDRVIARLRQYLPATFAELERPFAAGVYGPDGQPTLLREGDLAAAVTASCAIPGLFVPVQVGPGRWRDGGVKDRTGVDAWRAWRPAQPLLLHLIERSRGSTHEGDLSEVTVVRSPRSGASLWNLGDFAGQRAETAASARSALAAVGLGGDPGARPPSS